MKSLVISPAETGSCNRTLAPTATPHTVVVKLMGGLGNQMFQYAAGLAIARKNGVPLNLDITFLQKSKYKPHLTPRNYGLNIFPLYPGCEIIKEAESIPAGLKRVAEKHFHFDQAVTELAGGILLEGYWQSPRYFESVDKEIRQSFDFTPQLGDQATAVATQIKAIEVSVCLHVRRGDMVKNSHAASVHGSCSVEYYRTACDEIARRFPKAHFFVFSDDQRWCESQDLTRGRPRTIVSQPGETETPAVDFFLMRLCSHFITANSTFSWWAAYLARDTNKMVVVPDPWFTQPSMDISDLFPTDWIHLSRKPGPILKNITTDPSVSVIVPCYKQAHYLQEAVESVVGQTFADWELIVVNDGSPDHTSSLARELIARHPERKIRLLEKPNGGLANARNAGIEVARGKYILPLDSDDKLHPQMLQKTVALLESNPRITIAYTDLARFGSMTDVVALPEYDLKVLINRNLLNCCSLFRREAWIAVGGYNSNMKLGYEDWDFWIGCGEKGFIGKRIPEALFFYRVKGSSMFTKALENHQVLHAQIIENHPSLYNEPTRIAAKGILEKYKSIHTNDLMNIDTLKGKRVLIYTDDPGQGGAAHYNHSLLKALVESGAEALCAQPKGDSLLNAEQAKIGVKHYWTAYNPVVEFGRSFVDEADAERLFKQSSPDLVYFSDCCAFSHIAAKKVAISLNIPYLVICHSEATYLAERFAQFLPTVSAQLAQAYAVIGVSHNSLAVMRKYFGLAADKGQVIYNGCAETYFTPIDTAVRSRVRAELRIPADDILCLTAARLDSGKCHQLQLEAIRLLRDSGRLGALHFAWAGDGSLRQKLEQSIKEFKLEDRVHLLGYRWDIRDLMGSADIFVLTTLYEAMPLCILEAMAQGLPIVASSVGGIPEALGEAGILLPDPNRDPQKTIVTLIESLEVLAASPQRRRRFSAVGKARAQELFSASRMTQTTLDVLRQSLVEKIPTAASDELFGVDEVQVYEQLATTYSNNPTEAGVLGQLKQLQQGMMNFLVTAQSDKLEAQFKGAFGRVFRSIVNSGLSSEAPNEEAISQLAVLDEVLSSPVENKQCLDYRPLIARMLLAPAHRGSLIEASDSIPNWFQNDYFGYILTAPKVFVYEGEAEQYKNYLLGLTQAIYQRIKKAPKEKLTIDLALFFSNKANFIPLYVSVANTKDLAVMRANIIEFILKLTGAKIDANFPKRPKHRTKIKIGFLNFIFGQQTETNVTLPALQLDRNRFEICLFPVIESPSPIENYCRSLADSFKPLPNKLADQVKTIRKAELDIIIIGTNVTAVTNQVTQIALHRLAPVQLASYCSPVTTGMRHIDGYLTGTLNDYPDLQEHFCEKLLFCDGPPGCLDYKVEPKGSGRIYDRASLGLAEDDVVFVNAAACFKILPEMQETWAKILQAVPNSRLLLMPFNPNWTNVFPVKQFERTLTEAFARHGLGRERFILADSLPSRADVKALELLANVYLDTSPFSGSISVIDPLELGLPVVVQEGATHRSRMASALLREIELPELITTEEESYIKLAVRLGNDADYRRQLSERIVAAMARRPKFINAQAYAHGLAALLESLVRSK